MLLTLGQLGLPHPSLGGMVAALASRISREALHQRFTASATAFLRHCLHTVLRHKLQTVPIRTKLLQPFARVLLVDSSSWDVSEKLGAVLPGSGGNASTANCKLQTAYDYKQGELTFLADTAGTVPDNRYTDHLPALVNTTDLLLFDQGYFKLATLNALTAKGACFLTRLFLDTTVHDGQTSERLDLGQVLRTAPGPTFERQVRLGQGPNHTHACRLVGLRVPAQVAQARRRRFKAHARRQGRTGSPRHVAMCDWTLLITNVPESWLPLDMVRALYTLRWQIELLFKQFKSILRVHQSMTGNIHRLRCELYGKLITAVWVQRLHAVANTALWNTSRYEISLAKLYKRLQERAFLLAQLMMGSGAQTMSYLSQELETLLRHCRKYRQRSRMTTLEMLEAGFDPKLHRGKGR
ncbi:MAG: IS4 family transposase [Nitrospirales bacterium]|nr:MAG: IS4 family transposase [Nitrospirales bacterium]